MIYQAVATYSSLFKGNHVMIRKLITWFILNLDTIWGNRLAIYMIQQHDLPGGCNI